MSVRNEVNWKVKQEGEVYTVTTVTTVTKKETGKEPEVSVKETVEKYDAYSKMPEELRKALEKKQEDASTKPINKTPTKGNFTEDFLKLLNQYRQKHGAKPLKLSSELMKYCEERAKTIAEKDDMIHRENSKYGESITCMSSSNPEFAVSAEDICSKWYESHEGYDYSKEPNNMKAGHFTQMVWKSTDDFGVAACKSNTNKVYVVASYYPPGNYKDQFKDNVLAPKSTPFLETIKNKLSHSKDESSSDSDDDDKEKFRKQCLTAHNNYRKQHGVHALSYSKKLEDYAQEWAENIAKKDKLEHREPNKYGENLYCGYKSDPKYKATPMEACEKWYSEIKGYTFGREGMQGGTGHFTQVVWKSSKEVGMGYAKSKSGMHYIVANYDPAGNFGGEYVKNVQSKH